MDGKKNGGNQDLDKLIAAANVEDNDDGGDERRAGDRLTPIAPNPIEPDGR